MYSLIFSRVNISINLFDSWYELFGHVGASRLVHELSLHELVLWQRLFSQRSNKSPT